MSNYTHEQLESIGWRFIPSHDITLSSGMVKVVPDAWETPEGSFVYDNEVEGYVLDRLEKLKESYESIEQLAKEVHSVASSKGWHPNYETYDAFTVRTVACMHSEISELFEAYRKGNLHKPCDKTFPPGQELTCVEEELADLIIRALDTAEELGVDIVKAIVIKNEYNKTRPHRHGGKKA